MVRLQRVVPAGAAAVFAKLEQFNPSGSMEDRLAARVVERAAVEGLLKHGGTIVDEAGPDLAIALALACAVRGYPLHVVVSDELTREKRMLLKSSGCKVTFSPGSDGAEGARRRIEQITAETPGGFSLLGLLRERVVEQEHREIADEIIEAAEAEHVSVDAWVSEGSAGSAHAAIARGLKSRYPGLRRVAVVMGKGSSGSAPLGEADEEVVRVSPADAWNARGRLGREEGILSGVSSGAVLVAALKTAQEIGNQGCVFALFPDAGERYFSLAGKMR